MSVQLILYPQTYSGYSYNTFLTYNDYAANSYFSSSSFSNVLDIDQSPYGTGINNPANFYVGAWFGYYSGTAGATWNATAAPTISGGNLILTGAGGGAGPPFYSICGVAQPIPNLIVGDWYELIIEHTGVTLSDGVYFLGAFGQTDAIGNNGGFWPFQIMGGPANVSTYTFQAGFSTMPLIISFSGKEAAGTTSHQVHSIRVRETASGATVNYTDFSDGQVICDQYAEENIPLTLSIDDFKNVAEKVQSYSKDFNLPATKRNNKIFTHIFDITKTIQTSYDFNPYAKTRAVLKQDGILIFEGSLRLINIIDKEGEISYNVNLYSEAVALADVLKGRVIAEMDFTELEHAYDVDSIRDSWYNTTGLPLSNSLSTDSFAYEAAIGVDNTNVLKYPFVNWTGNIPLANGSTGNNSNLDYPELTTLQDAFRPFIQAKYLIDRMFFEAGYEYTSTFFETDRFKKLFVDFNWGQDQINPYESGVAVYQEQGSSVVYAAVSPSYTTLQFDKQVTFGVLSGYDAATGVFTCISDNTTYSISYDIDCHNALLSGQTNAAFTIEWYTTGTANPLGPINQQTFSGLDPGDNVNYSGSINVILNVGDTLYCRFSCTAGNATTIRESSTITYDEEIISGIISTGVMSGGAISQNERGQTNQWEFLKGILTMFNLITIPQPQNPNNILIEPYEDVFIDNPNGTTLLDRSIQHDWTHKIDIDDIDLKPLDLKKSIVFSYEIDEEDYCLSVYKNKLNYEYGAKEINAENLLVSPSQTGNLVGKEEIIATPFSATLSRPLFSQFTDFVVPQVYSSNKDGTEHSGFSNKARILYNNGVVDMNSAGVTYYIPEQNGKSSQNAEKFLQFSHLSTIPTVVNSTIDYNFESKQLVSPLGLSPTDNLYNKFYSSYFGELYDKNTRIMTLKVNLNASDINTFKFTDKVMIKNRVFRVNRIDYNPNELSTVEFILIP
tara:strand:+ start:38 stop:2893 length:2856 start_codon:yes stop_codon:yes gene_type:complete